MMYRAARIILRLSQRVSGTFSLSKSCLLYGVSKDIRLAVHRLNKAPYIMNVHRRERIRRRYIALHGEEPVGEGELEAIESALRFNLPLEVKEITTFYSGGILGGIEHAAIESSGPAESIVSLTSAFRAGDWASAAIPGVGRSFRKRSRDGC